MEISAFNPSKRQAEENIGKTFFEIPTKLKRIRFMERNLPCVTFFQMQTVVSYTRHTIEGIQLRWHDLFLWVTKNDIKLPSKSKWEIHIWNMQCIHHTIKTVDWERSKFFPGFLIMILIRWRIWNFVVDFLSTIQLSRCFVVLCANCTKVW